MKNLCYQGYMLLHFSPQSLVAKNAIRWNSAKNLIFRMQQAQKNNPSKIWKRNTRFLILLSEFHAKWTMNPSKMKNEKENCHRCYHSIDS